MTQVPHTLGEEFPDQAAVIGQLTDADPAFAQLAAHYHDVNNTVYRIEAGFEPTADEILENFKKHRLKLKDEIAAYLIKTGH